MAVSPGRATSPVTRYAKSGEFHIAYQVVGDGEVDLVYVPGWISQLDLYWEEPSVARFLRALGSFSRLIVFDKRGTGLSDRVPESALPTLEERMDDVRAVMDAVPTERAALLGQGYACPIAMMFAATYPERTSALVLYAATVKAGLRTDDYPWGSTPKQNEEWRRRSTEGWGSEEFAGEWLARVAPTAAGDPRAVDWVARLMRATGSPSNSRAFMAMNHQMDARPILPAIHVPTLVLDRSQATLPKGGVDFPPLEASRYVAERIPGSRFVALPGRDYLPWVGETDALVAEIAAFVTGRRDAPAAERMLVTILFTDIVESTRRASQLGDSRWKEALEEHRRIVRDALELYRGREIEHTGDGFLATFDGPARAIRCAELVIETSRAAGLEIRAGIHTGEVEVVEAGIGGIAVHIGARAAAKARTGEVLVTRTVVDLVAGSGIEFVDRGTHVLKGVEGRWRLFAVQQSAG